MKKVDIAKRAYEKYLSFYHPIERNAIHAIIYPKTLEDIEWKILIYLSKPFIHIFYKKNIIKIKLTFWKIVNNIKYP